MSGPAAVELERANATMAGARVAVWATASCADRLATLLGREVSSTPPSLEGVDWLLAAGGGMLMDEAKILRAAHPHVKLALLPTLWGSGAQATSIAVTRDGASKIVRKGAELAADLVVLHPELGRSAPPELARHECGDAWSHALEGFLSPLATDATRTELAEVMRAMLALPLAFDPRWFELGARAAAGQAASSVGVVHGIAHVLEGRVGRGHAALCSTFLLPAMRFIRKKSPSWLGLLEPFRVPLEGVWGVLERLSDPAALDAALPALREEWGRVLRDPCTRTNAVLVRPGDLEDFVSCARG